jgi:hypothetical protein
MDITITIEADCACGKVKAFSVILLQCLEE